MVPRNPAVAAVIVTRNRRDLLHQCLTAVYAQRAEVDEVFVVDNASTDGTPQMLAEDHPRATVVLQRENLGGAGGFHVALAAALQRPVDYLWVLDDDTLPGPETLERLLAARHAILDAGLAAPAVMASRVVWRDGQDHPMNTPGARPPTIEQASHQARVSPIRYCSFVSVLLEAREIRRRGLPLSEYFLWLDDTEFTGRLLRDRPGYLVADSVVTHQTTDPYRPIEAADRFYFAVRNRVFLIRGDSFAGERAHWIRNLVFEVKAFLERQRWSKTALRTVARGLKDGLLTPVPRPKPAPALACCRGNSSDVERA